MKLFFKLLSILGLVLLLGTILFLLFLPELSTDVQLVSASKNLVNNEISVIASVKSEREYTLYSPSKGVIMGMSVQLNEVVKKGQELAQVIKEDDEITDLQTETRLLNKIAQYGLEVQQNNRELVKLNNAVNVGVLPRYKLDAVNASIKRATTSLSAAKNELRSYRLDKRKRNKIVHKQVFIKALSNGIVTRIDAYDGQWISRGNPILHIVSTDNLYIKAMLTPEQVGSLVLGQDVIVSKQNSMLKWEEKIINISPIISQEISSKNLQEVTVSLMNAEGVEQTVNEKVKLKFYIQNLNSDMESLPIEAVVNEGKNFYIWYVDKSKKVTFDKVYAANGFIQAVQFLKCQFVNCNAHFYGVSKKSVELGRSDINRVQLKQNLKADIKIILADSNIDEESFVILRDPK